MAVDFFTKVLPSEHTREANYWEQLADVKKLQLIA